MATLIDFSKYVLNGLKIENLTQDILLGPAFNLLKGTCSSSIELEYNFQECFNALTDKLDWNNPEGDQVTYTSSITKTKAARYEIKGIEDMVSKFSKHNVYSTKAILGVKSVSVKKLRGYGHLEEIVVKRSDQQLYKFKEGDFVDLHLNDIEDMLLLSVQHKLFHLVEERSGLELMSLQALSHRDKRVGTLKSVRDEIITKNTTFVGYNPEMPKRKCMERTPIEQQGDFVDLHLNDIEDVLLLVVQHKLLHLDGSVIIDFIMALRMFTRSLILRRRVEDLQLGKRVLRADELYKFSDGTLKSVRDEIHHSVLEFLLDYNTEMPKRKWRAVDQKRSGLMIELIDKQLREKGNHQKSGAIGWCTGTRD
ncbi:hypothetical protein Tco_1312805 [Tanacetum coccineum]